MKVRETDCYIFGFIDFQQSCQCNSLEAQGLVTSSRPSSTQLFIWASFA